MLTHNLPFHRFSRLMAVMFAVQIVVGGFCLLTAEAHTMSASVQSSGMDAHCAKSVHTISNNEHNSDHSGNCYHCDQAEQLSNSVVSSAVSMTLVLVDMISLPVTSLFGSDAAGLFTIRTPTGPPRSSSLLYSITQRIRV